MTDPTRTRKPGRIITFYSYKGGTGRTMALANVGWILAAAGYRVLVIDWDLEAPGLHRYLHPFLEDPELTSTPGLIDLFVDFSASARIARTSTAKDEKWYESAASVLRYATPVTGNFGSGGGLDLVPAGRQDAGYAVRTSSFDWREFYDALGGGIFLEALKRRLRQDYEFILIDSRTGLSDTAGICTVQMPDELVVLFTLNQQSIKGAYAIADSAEQQRLKPTGEPALRIWPVATRVELAEKERLEAARDLARSTFQRFIKHMPRAERNDYWGHAEILYQPYYAYEEVLATFADRPGLTNSLLSAMETMATRIAGLPTSFRIPDSERLSMLAKYQRAPRAAVPLSTSRPLVFISYAAGDEGVVGLLPELADAVRSAGAEAWLDQFELIPGDDWSAVSRDAIARSVVVLAVLGAGTAGPNQRREVELARKSSKRLIPVVVNASPSAADPTIVGTTFAATINQTSLDKDLASLTQSIRRFLDRDAKEEKPTLDPDDLNRGRFGGASTANGRMLTAKVTKITEDWFRVRVTVAGSTDPLNGEVQFHLDPSTFPSPVRKVTAENGSASYQFQAWGAFTIGAIADGGNTLLELNLATLSDAPKTFRER
jgi:MinD-like ATPase involved in chromosome partitioning or flagellar assembly